MKEHIFYDFRKDNYFTELKQHEIMSERMTQLDTVDGYVGRYYSIEWVKKNILQQDEDEIKEIAKQIAGDEKEGSEEGEGDTQFGAFVGRPDVMEPQEELPPEEEQGALPAPGQAPAAEREEDLELTSKPKVKSEAFIVNG